MSAAVKLACTAACAECDWSYTGTQMEATNKAADKHGRAEKHSTSWHCQVVK